MGSLIIDTEEQKKLSEITELITDGSHFSPQTIEKGYPYVTVRDISDKGEVDIVGCKKISPEDFSKLVSGNCKPQIGDVLFSKDGTVGKVALVTFDTPFVVLSSLAIIRPNKKVVLPKFLAYMFSSPNIREYAIGLKTGAAIKRVVLKTIKNLVFPIPSLKEQEDIVEKLDALFARLDEAIALLEENTYHMQALMGSVLNEIYSEGDTNLQDVCSINPRKSEVRDLPEDTMVSFLPMAELNEHRVDFTPIEEKPLGEVYKGYTYFKDGDVLLAKVTPCFENGKAGLAKNLINGIGFGSSEFHVLRASEEVLPEWVYYAILSAQFRESGKANMTGSSGLKRVPPQFVAEWKIPVPDIATQTREIKKITRIHEHTIELEKAAKEKLNYLKSLKNSLLDAAFKGELKNTPDIPVTI